MIQAILDKRLLDEIIRLTRKFSVTGDADILPAKHRVSDAASIDAFGADSKWLAITDMVSAIVGVSGMSQHAPNEIVYAAFEAIGIAVRDKAQEVQNAEND